MSMKILYINVRTSYGFLLSSDICTTLWYNFHDNFGFFFFDWSKIIETKKVRERIRR